MNKYYLMWPNPKDLLLILVYIGEPHCPCIKVKVYGGFGLSKIFRIWLIQKYCIYAQRKRECVCN